MKHWLIEHGVYVVLALALCGSGVYFLLHLTRDADANSAALLANQQKFGAMLDKIQRPCNMKEAGKDVPCGTLADINRDADSLRQTLDLLNIAARHEDRNLTALDAQEKQLFEDANGTLNAGSQLFQQGQKTLATAEVALGGVRPLLDRLTEDAAQLQPAEKHLDELIEAAQPAVVNAQSMTASGARILKDGADEADKLAHPPKKKLTFWTAMWAGLTYVHKLEPPIF